MLCTSPGMCDSDGLPRCSGARPSDWRRGGMCMSGCMLQPRVRLELGHKTDSTQQPDVSHKEDIIPHTSLIKIPSHTLFAHSQWPQDKLPVLSATLPGNWLPLLPRSAPLSRPSTPLRAHLPPRLLSPPSSSRPVASRPLTLLAPRRPSTVSSAPIERTKTGS